MEYMFGKCQKLPELNTNSMIEVERMMMEEFGISFLQMMENAGRALAILCKELVPGKSVVNKRIVILAGVDGNGGGALAAGRRLTNWGAAVTVVLGKEFYEIAGAQRHQYDILLDLPGVAKGEPGEDEIVADLIIDGLVGCSLLGAASQRTRLLIDWANSQNAPTLSLDVPSGLDTNSGLFRGPAIKANATLTVALPKLGLQDPQNRRNVGELYCADISVPPELYMLLPRPLDVGPIFNQSDILIVEQ